MIRYFNERAMYWTRHTDVSASFADLDEMLRVLDPVLIATGHGGVVDVRHEMVPLVKAGMDVRGPETPAPPATVTPGLVDAGA